MYHMIEGSRDSSYWTPNIVVQALIGIWFAAAHQPWVVRLLVLQLVPYPDPLHLRPHRAPNDLNHLEFCLTAS